MKGSNAWMLVLTVPLAACCHFCRQPVTGGAATNAGAGPAKSLTPTDTIFLYEQDVVREGLRPPPAGVVEIVVRCDSASATVNDYHHSVRQHGTMSWAFEGSDTLRIAPKPPADWPFAVHEPIATPGHPASSGDMVTPRPVGTVIHYRGITRCGTHPVVIDPEIIIIPD